MLSISITNTLFVAMLITVVLLQVYGVVHRAEYGDSSMVFRSDRATFDTVGASACFALALGSLLLRSRTTNLYKKVLADAVTSNLLHVAMMHLFFRLGLGLDIRYFEGRLVPVLYYVGIIVAGMDAAITMDAFRAYRISTGAESKSRAWPTFSSGIAMMGINGGHAWIAVSQAAARATNDRAAQWSIGIINIAYVAMAITRAWPFAIHGPGASGSGLKWLSPVEQLSAARMNLLNGGWYAAVVMFAPMMLALIAELLYCLDVLGLEAADILIRQQIIVRALEAGYMLVTSATQNDEATAQEVVKRSLEARLAAKLAEDEARQAMVRYLFHEVRVPLNSVYLGLELLADEQDQLSAEHQQYIGTMLSAVRTAIGVLSDTLDLARLERGEASALELEGVSLPELAESIVQQNRPFAVGMGVGLTAVVDGDVPEYALLAEAQLRQVLNNYVTNAIKFSAGLEGGRDGKVTVYISTRIPSVVTAAHAASYTFRQASFDSGSGMLGATGMGEGSTRTLPVGPVVDTGGDSAGQQHNHEAPGAPAERVQATARPGWSDWATSAWKGLTTTRAPAEPGRPRLSMDAATLGAESSASTPNTSPKARNSPKAVASPVTPGKAKAQRHEASSTSSTPRSPRRGGAVSRDRESAGLSHEGEGGIGRSSTAATGNSLLDMVDNGPIPAGWLAAGRPKWVYFTVVDSGCGIPTKAMAKLFMPFQMLGAAKDGQKRGRGTGLGLAIARTIAKRLGGEVGLYSTEGKGSAFFLRLPLQPLQPTADPDESSVPDILAVDMTTVGIGQAPLTSASTGLSGRRNSGFRRQEQGAGPGQESGRSFVSNGSSSRPEGANTDSRGSDGGGPVQHHGAKDLPAVKSFVSVSTGYASSNVSARSIGIEHDHGDGALGGGVEWDGPAEAHRRASRHRDERRKSGMRLNTVPEDVDEAFRSQEATPAGGLRSSTSPSSGLPGAVTGRPTLPAGSPGGRVLDQILSGERPQSLASPDFDGRMGPGSQGRLARAGPSMHDATLARMALWASTSPTPSMATMTGQGAFGSDTDGSGRTRGGDVGSPAPDTPEVSVGPTSSGGPTPVGDATPADLLMAVGGGTPLLTVNTGLDSGAQAWAGEGKPAPRPAPVTTTATATALVSGPAPTHYLVVDDVASNRLFLARLLRRRAPNAVVFEVEHGQACLDEIARAKREDGLDYDVVCMDGDMPVLDGYEATRLLREAGFAGLILGCTGNALPADQQRFIDAGAQAVITKPIDPILVVNKTQDWQAAKAGVSLPHDGTDKRGRIKSRLSARLTSDAAGSMSTLPVGQANNGQVPAGNADSAKDGPALRVVTVPDPTPMPLSRPTHVASDHREGQPQDMDRTAGGLGRGSAGSDAAGEASGHVPVQTTADVSAVDLTALPLPLAVEVARGALR